MEKKGGDIKLFCCLTCNQQKQERYHFLSTQHWGGKLLFVTGSALFSELQIRGVIEDNSKIIFLISQQKHIL